MQLLPPLLDLGQAEIRYLYHALLVQHDVFRLDITMHDALGGGSFECRRCLAHDLQRRCDGDLLLLRGKLLEVVAQGLTFNELLHDVMLAINGPRGIDLHDVGMSQTCSCIGLAFKAFDIE